MKSNEIKVIVATFAFRMGIDKEDILHIFRYGVPESLTSYIRLKSWGELAEMDMHPATGTIIILQYG